jgi:hypothetical protein
MKTLSLLIALSLSITLKAQNNALSSILTPSKSVYTIQAHLMGKNAPCHYYTVDTVYWFRNVGINYISGDTNHKIVYFEFHVVMPNDPNNAYYDMSINSIFNINTPLYQIRDSMFPRAVDTMNNHFTNW